MTGNSMLSPLSVGGCPGGGAPPAPAGAFGPAFAPPAPPEYSGNAASGLAAAAAARAGGAPVGFLRPGREAT